MARVMVVVLVLVSLGMVYRATSGSGGAPAAAAQQADAQLGQVEKGFTAAVAAQQSRQRAVASEVTRDAALFGALGKAAGKDDGPSIDDAPALKEAIDQALAKLPEGDRSYAAAAMATSSGAVAVVPGHEPLAASSFAWLDAAVSAGGNGRLADVAGHRVQVFAAKVHGLKGEEVTDVGTVAIAFARDASGMAKLVDDFPGITLVQGGKVLASSDKAHADAAAKLTAPGAFALERGQPDSFLMKLPMPEAVLVQARAFALPGAEGVLAVATADQGKVVAATAEGQKGGLQALLAILILGAVALVFAGRGGAAVDDVADVAAAQPAYDPQASLRTEPPPPRASPPPSPEVPRFPPTPPPSPAVVPSSPSPAAAPLPAPVRAAPPPPPGRSITPPPAPVAAASGADPVPGFDELFGPPPIPPKSAPQAETRAAMPAAPPASPSAATAAAMPVASPMSSGPAMVPLPPSNQPADPLGFLSAAGSAGGELERTGVMSRDMLVGLAAQSAQPAGSNGLSASPGMARPGAVSPPDERTAVAAVPADILRAASRPGGPAGAQALSAEEQHFQEVFREFMQTRERCGEPPENLTFEKFSAKLRKNKEQLVQKYACKSVRFQVYVKEGKAALKATPVKDA